MRDNLSWITFLHITSCHNVPHFDYNSTWFKRPPVLTDHIIMVNGDVFQDRFYCTCMLLQRFVMLQFTMEIRIGCPVLFRHSFWQWLFIYFGNLTVQTLVWQLESSDSDLYCNSCSVYLGIVLRMMTISDCCSVWTVFWQSDNCAVWTVFLLTVFVLIDNCAAHTCLAS